MIHGELRRRRQLRGWGCLLPRPSAVPRHRLMPLVAALLVVTTGALPALVMAQEQPAPAARFFEVVQVEVVSIEVIATDKVGNWVGDLAREDFQVLEDGKPVELSNFLVVDEGLVVATADEAESPSQPVRPPVSLVVFFDNANLRPMSRNRVLDDLKELVMKRLGEGDRVMMVSAERGVRVLTPFTRDLNKLTPAFDVLAKTAGAATAVDSQRRMILRSLEQTMNPEEPILDAQDALNDIRTYAASQQQDGKRTLAALQEFASSLAGLPGRKALIYVSDGFASRPAEDLYNAWFARYGQFASRVGVTHPSFEAGRDSLSVELQETVANANASGVTFFSVSASGLDTSGDTMPDVSGIAGDGTRVADPMLTYVDTVNRVDTLQRLAYATGGRVITKPTADTLSTVSQDLERYYSLGYDAPSPGDKRTHKIEVTSSRRDVKLRYRDTRRGKPIEERATEAAYGALWGAVSDNPLDLEMDISRFADRDGGAVLVRVLVTFASDKVTLIPRGATRDGMLQLFFVAQNQQGEVSPAARLEVPLSVPEEHFSEGVQRRLGYSAQLRLRPGKQGLAVCALDEIAQQTSLARATINVAEDGVVTVERRSLMGVERR